MEKFTDNLGKVSLTAGTTKKVCIKKYYLVSNWSVTTIPKGKHSVFKKT